MNAHHDRWLSSLDRYVQWVEEHGRPPRSTGREVSDEERRAAHWMMKQRREQEALSQEKVAALDAAVPDWSARRKKSWDETFSDLERWVGKHGRRPRSYSSDREEARLGQWVSHMQSAASGSIQSIPLTPARRRKLEAVVPGWNGIRRPTWEETVAQVADWVNNHEGELPTRPSDDPETRRLASWLANQKQIRRGNVDRRTRTQTSRDRERFTYLDSLIPGWDRRKTKKKEDYLPHIIRFRSQDPPMPWARIADELGTSASTAARWWREAIKDGQSTKPEAGGSEK